MTAHGRPRFRSTFLGGHMRHSAAAAAAQGPASTSGGGGGTGPSLEAELAGLACKVVALGDRHAAALAGAHPQLQADLRSVANRLHSIAAALAVGPPPSA